MPSGHEILPIWRKDPISLSYALWRRRLSESIGYAAADHMWAELVVEAVQQAAFTREYDCTATICHTECGSQFISGPS